MPKAYSLDLRERVARVVRGGRSCHAAAAQRIGFLRRQADEGFPDNRQACSEGQRRAASCQA
jgi:hypothetical protein